ncbi:MAG: hypothetical protein ABI220_02440 [Candidatus Saccharimonadales bacterium]
MIQISYNPNTANKYAAEFALNTIVNVGGERQTSCQPFDNNELANLQGSEEPDGTINIGRFLNRQYEDRVTYGVPSDMIQLSLIPGRHNIINSGGRRITDTFGFSYRQGGEVVVAADLIRDESGLEPNSKLIKQLIAYTALHEYGHMRGLARTDPPTEYGHCPNLCAMRSTGSTTETAHLIGAMGRLAFCNDCTGWLGW